MILYACLLVVVLSLTSPDCPEITRGFASHYSAGVFEPTIFARQEMGQLPTPIPDIYAGFAATLDCHLMGDTVWARHKPSEVFLPFLVADCAQRDGLDGTKSWMSENNILLELDYHSARRWKGIGRGLPIEVIFDCGRCPALWEDYHAYRLSLSKLSPQLALSRRLVAFGDVGKGGGQCATLAGGQASEPWYQDRVPSLVRFESGIWGRLDCQQTASQTVSKQLCRWPVSSVCGLGRCHRGMARTSRRTACPGSDYLGSCSVGGLDSRVPYPSWLGAHQAGNRQCYD